MWQEWKLQEKSAFLVEKYQRDLPVNLFLPVLNCPRCTSGTSGNGQNFELSLGKVPEILTCPPLLLPVLDGQTVCNFHPHECICQYSTTEVPCELWTWSLTFDIILTQVTLDHHHITRKICDLNFFVTWWPWPRGHLCSFSVQIAWLTLETIIFELWIFVQSISF